MTIVKSVQFNGDSLYSDVIKEFEDNGFCTDAGIYAAELLKDDPNITLRVATEKYIKSGNNPGWVVWMFKFIEFDSEVRLSLINKITNPMQALKLYAKGDLTEAEATVLESTFKDQLPTAEKELNEGVTTIKDRIELEAV